MREKIISGILSLALLGFTLTASPRPRAADLTAQLSDLVQAEISFSKTAGEKGIREAFLTFLAERSLVFRPMPVDGRKTYEQSPGDSGTLSWYPVVADISRTYDLGYTTGPYQYRSEKAAEPVRHGNYASVWRKLPDSDWKVILDCGTGNPAPNASPEPWQPPASMERVFDPAGLRLDPAVERRKLLEADREFSSAVAGRKVSAGYQTFLAPAARYLRPGMAPVLGKKAILATVLKSKIAWEWEPSDAGVSAGADLGYTYGRMSAAGGAEAYYVRVWKRDPTGAWHVVLDVANPVPAAQK
jgi:ketosteroid isomerase-like protein